MTKVQVVILNLYYSPSSLSAALVPGGGGGGRKKILPDSGLEPVWTGARESTWRQTCTSAVWRLEARVSPLRRPLPGGKSGSLLRRPPLCAATEELWLSEFATSPVTPAELQKGANGCGYGRLPQHLLRGDTLLPVPPGGRGERVGRLEDAPGRRPFKVTR